MLAFKNILVLAYFFEIYCYIAAQYFLTFSYSSTFISFPQYLYSYAGPQRSLFLISHYIRIHHHIRFWDLVCSYLKDLLVVGIPVFVYMIVYSVNGFMCAKSICSISLCVLGVRVSTMSACVYRECVYAP